MDAEWIKSPTARRILMHWADRRPAWLWSHNGATLLWRNASARLFTAKLKKSGLKLGGEAVPIKGQVARMIRLGAPGRSSLSRVQFLAGDKPLATTCSCTPLALPDGEMALLLVGVEPIDPEIRTAAGESPPDVMSQALFPPAADYLVVEGGKVEAGSPHALAAYGPSIEATGLPEESDSVSCLQASPEGATLLIYPPPAIYEPPIDTARDEEGENPAEADEQVGDLSDMPEPMLPMGLDPLPSDEMRPVADVSDNWVEPLPPEPDRTLSSLFDRLAGDASLYTTLTAADEVFEPQGQVATGETLLGTDEPTEPAAPEGPPPAPDLIAAVIEYADDPEQPEGPAEQPSTQWMITGRSFRRRLLSPDEEAPPAPQPSSEDAPRPEPEPRSADEPPAVTEPRADEPEQAATLDPMVDLDAVERVSRYNFEELGRILTDRVSNETRPEAPEPVATAANPVAIINLNAETLVLNRLPLAILVFRDQQVLFANRALIDLLGHDSVESLRSAGIASIFPTAENASAGPVNQLVRRDATLLPVTARLQSVSWQGRAALMLSASPAEPVRGHEAAVRAFAEIAAEAREEGFLIADRAGLVTQISGIGRTLLAGDREIVGKPLAVLVSKQDMEPLRTFLEKPARFAETARPSLIATSEDGEADIALFAEGQAGVVSGYFGFLKRRQKIALADDSDRDIEPSMLARLSRGVRRPLNTIIGFADLIRSAGLSSVDAERTLEYARDIRTAGLEIAVLVDELDDFTRLRDGRYAARPSAVDLAALLESCMVRIKVQAGAARVLVRSAISERLPRIRADRASLGQALLNLLASAIDQTPIGGSVILSAQASDEGGVAVHVRDGAKEASDLAERFVVFRDGLDRDGEELSPVRSSVGLALTRSLLAVNACSLSVDPTPGIGTLLSLMIPADLVVKA